MHHVCKACLDDLQIIGTLRQLAPVLATSAIVADFGSGSPWITCAQRQSAAPTNCSYHWLIYVDIVCVCHPVYFLDDVLSREFDQHVERIETLLGMLHIYVSKSTLDVLHFVHNTRLLGGMRAFIYLCIYLKKKYYLYIYIVGLLCMYCIQYTYMCVYVCIYILYKIIHVHLCVCLSLRVCVPTCIWAHTKPQ